jgi:hypothetical protein
MHPIIGGEEEEPEEEEDDMVSDEELAADVFLANPEVCQSFQDNFTKEEIIDYLHMKCINEVNMPIDAVQRKHLRMIGGKHNLKGQVSADAEGLEDPEVT